MKLFMMYENDNKEKEKILVHEGKIEEIDKFTMCFNSEGDLFKKITASISNKDLLWKIKPYSFCIITSHNNVLPVLFSKYKFLLNDECKIDTYRLLMQIEKERIYEFLKTEYGYFFEKEFNQEEKRRMEYNVFYRLYTNFFEKEEYKNPESNGAYNNFFLCNIKNNYRALRQMSFSIFDIIELNELNKKSKYNFDKVKIEKICLKSSMNILQTIKVLQQKPLNYLDKNDRILLEDFDREDLIDLEDKGYKYE